MTPCCHKVKAFLMGCCSSWAGRLIPAAVAGSVAAVAFTAYQTLRTHEPPLIADGEQIAYTSLAGDMIMVEYERDITILQDFTGTVTRTIVCENGWSNDVPATIRWFKEGKYHAARSFLVPYAVPKATRCKMETLVTWTPPMSLREHGFKLAPIPFVIIPNDRARLDRTTPSSIRNPLTKPDEVFPQDGMSMGMRPK